MIAIWRADRTALADDVDAVLLVVFLCEALEVLGGTQQGDAAARHDAFFNRRTVACIASSTRSLRSLTSTSVAPPTRITATRLQAWPDAPAASQVRSPR